MMKRALLLLLMLSATWFAPAFAQKPELVIGPGLNSGRTAYHQNYNRTLSNDTLYILTGLYYVDSTHSMTIQKGTTVLGDTAAALIIKRGAQIFAQGEADAPIVFSSRQPVGSKERGDWGGILILGKAPCNKVEPLIEGGIIEGTYGGSEPHDNSGVFCYVRIELCGYRYQLNNEVNGLTMGGVGDGTEIHHVQVSYSFDDSFEWFGGTVNCSHLVTFGGTDDEFDTDFGYTGHLQYCFGLRDMDYWDPTGESNGFESDNDGSSTSKAQPYTEPIFTNVTLVGPERTDAWVGNLPPGHKFQYSEVLRRSTRTKIYNSCIIGYPWGVSIRDPYTIAAAQTDTLQQRNVSMAASLKPGASTSIHEESKWAGVTAWWNTLAYANNSSATRMPSTLGLTDMSDFNNPDPVPAAGSELIGTASFDSPYLAWPGFDVVTYRGAFDPALPMSQQWTAGWTNFDPKNTHYVLTGITERTDVPANAGSLLASYPNPFNPSTTIRFTVLNKGNVSLKVYDVRGNEVAALLNREMAPGTFEFVWNAPANLASGIYFSRLIGSGFAGTGKMVLVK